MQVATVSLLSEFVMGVGVAVLLTKAVLIGLESEYGILIACNGKITTQYLVNQWHPTSTKYEESSRVM